MIVYKVINLLNNEVVYVGQTTKSLNWRISVHRRKFESGKKSKLYDAFAKFGFDNFSFEEICSARSKDELDALEKYYIAKYNCINNGYNIQSGGSNSLTYHLDDIDRKHISEGMKKYRKDNPFTLEHRAKLSKSAMGNHNFGIGDTRSISCYCILLDNTIHHFHSYRDAWNWWKNIDNPFDSDTECIFQRKIKQSIQFGYYTYKGITYDSPKWFKEEG